MTTATEQIAANLTARDDAQIVTDYTTACVNFRNSRGTPDRSGWGVLVAAIERDMKRRDLGDVIDVVLDELDALEVVR